MSILSRPPRSFASFFVPPHLLPSLPLPFYSTLFRAEKSVVREFLFCVRTAKMKKNRAARQRRTWLLVVDAFLPHILALISMIIPCPALPFFALPYTSHSSPSPPSPPASPVPPPELPPPNMLETARFARDIPVPHAMPSTTMPNKPGRCGS